MVKLGSLPAVGFCADKMWRSLSFLKAASHHQSSYMVSFQREGLGPLVKDRGATEITEAGKKHSRFCKGKMWASG